MSHPSSVDVTKAIAILRKRYPAKGMVDMADPAEVSGRFRIVIANILLNTLEELARAIASRVAPGGRLVLCGLLAEQADAAERAYVAQGLRPVSRKDRDGWVRVELLRPLQGSR